MILQSLYRLYDRLEKDPEYSIAPEGYSLQNVAFVVVIHPDGRLHQIMDLRDHTGNQPRPIKMKVPGQSKPSGSGLNPGFLWDNPAYSLGYIPPREEKEGVEEYIRKGVLRTVDAFESFRERHQTLEAEIDDGDFSSVCRFLEQWDPEQALGHPLLSQIQSGFGVFQMVGEMDFIHQRNNIRDWWDRQQQTAPPSASDSVCLISGEHAPAVLVHEPAIKGITGQQPSGAKIVSFNCEAFTSYGKEQSRNAPVSKSAAFRYSTVLNALSSGPKSNRHRFHLGDTTILFWTAQPTQTESWLGALLTGDLSLTEVQESAALQQVDVLLKALRSGGGELSALGDDPSVPVYLLGLAPNAARLSVRFWYTETLRHLFGRLKAHYDALRIVPQFEAGSKRPDPEFPANWMLLRETARESKEIPPLLAGALMRAILGGTPYPDALASAVIRRIRADRTINYIRAATLKAWLVRLNRLKGGIPVSLDIERTEPAYRLGRLFAALEKTQEDALPGINATIRDRFYSAASATPSMVFPRLMRTYQHHLGKLPMGQKINREKLIQEIMDGLVSMPPHLNLEAQALFAIGYYHQRKALFGGKVTRTADPDNSPETESQE